MEEKLRFEQMSKLQKTGCSLLERILFYARFHLPRKNPFKRACSRVVTLFA